MTGWICEPLSRDHVLDRFACGNASLDDWLREWAHRSERADIGRTYVTHDGDNAVLGYFTLIVHALDRDGELPDKRSKRSVPRQVPAVLLAKLAIDERVQGKGFGRDLLIAAMERTIELADIAGCRYMVVDAIDDSAAAFYEKHDFVRIPNAESMRLALLVADVRETLSAVL